MTCLVLTCKSITCWHKCSDKNMICIWNVISCLFLVLYFNLSIHLKQWMCIYIWIYLFNGCITETSQVKFSSNFVFFIFSFPSSELFRCKYKSIKVFGHHLKMLHLKMELIRLNCVKHTGADFSSPKPTCSMQVQVALLKFNTSDWFPFAKK